MTLFRNHGGLHNSVSVTYVGESEDEKENGNRKIKPDK